MHVTATLSYKANFRRQTYTIRNRGGSGGNTIKANYNYMRLTIKAKKRKSKRMGGNYGIGSRRKEAESETLLSVRCRQNADGGDGRRRGPRSGGGGRFGPSRRFNEAIAMPWSSHRHCHRLVVITRPSSKLMIFINDNLITCPTPEPKKSSKTPPTGPRCSI